jgi:adenylate kinase family enzyme
VAVFGPAGSGKTTHARLLARRFNWRHLSAGALLRSHLGETGNTNMQAGELVDDALIEQLLLAALQSDLKTVILDGFPRNLAQAEWLAQNDIQVPLAIEIAVPEAEAERRLRNRQRTDDEQRAVERRHAIYEHNFYAIKKLLEQSGTKFLTVSSAGEIPAVNDRMVQAIEAFQANQPAIRINRENA